MNDPSVLDELQREDNGGLDIILVLHLKIGKLEQCSRKKIVPSAKEADDGSRQFNKICPRQITLPGWPPCEDPGSD